MNDLEQLVSELLTKPYKGKVPIMVWEFHEAPLALQALSQHGGDEDWIAVVPPYLVGAYIPWLEGPGFGSYNASEHPLPDGSMVLIAAHA